MKTCRKFFITTVMVVPLTLISGCADFMTSPDSLEGGAKPLTVTETHNQLVQTLNDLLQVDIDTYHAYNQACEAATNPRIKKILRSFRADHERHITALTSQVKKLGGVPYEFKRDFSGYLISGYTVIRSTTGTVGALKAMKSNENVSNERYRRAVAVTMPVAVKRLIQRHWADERRHLSRIHQLLAELNQ